MLFEFLVEMDFTAFGDGIEVEVVTDPGVATILAMMSNARFLEATVDGKDMPVNEALLLAEEELHRLAAEEKAAQ